MKSAPSTIAAVATPPGIGAVAVLRVSGPDTADVVGRLLPPSRRPRLERHGRRFFSSFHDPGSRERLDEGLVHVFRAPKSFTGEDVIELQGHGGRVAPQRLLDAALRAGAVAARPGEFTKRALLNGKLDLLQAEALLDLVRARSEGAQRQAVYQLAGSLSRKIERLRATLLEAMSSLELQIDFAEEDVELPRDWVRRIEAARAEILALLDTYRIGEALRDGVRVVIAGLPNVGKSSLFNMLLGSERAIVTSIPGTTRDAIEGEISVGGMLFRLVDTAGIRDGGGEIEIIGIDLARRHLDRADIVLLVLDGTREVSDAEGRLVEAVRTRAHVIVSTKEDLLYKSRASNDGLVINNINHEAVPTSAVTGRGREELLLCLLQLSGGGSRLHAQDPTLTHLRQKHQLEAALRAVDRCLGVLSGEASWPEKAASDLREAADQLDELTGRVTSEDVLDAIFSEFCIGK